MGSDNGKPRRRGMIRMILIPGFVLVVMVIGFFVVNFKFMSVDIGNTSRINTHYQENQLPPAPKQNLVIPAIQASSLSTIQSPSIVAKETIIQPVETSVVQEKPIMSMNEEIKSENNESNVNSVFEKELQTQVEKNEQTETQQDLIQSNNQEMNLVSSNQSMNLRSESSLVEEQSIQSMKEQESITGEEYSCIDTPLSEAIKSSTIFSLSDFDCSVSNYGWKDHIPPPLTNSTRSENEWKKRVSLLQEYSVFQDNYPFDNDNGKYIVFWPIFAGIGNNLAVFAEVLLISILTNRKFLVYDWDSLRDYFYLPFQYEVLTTKVWEKDPTTLIVEKTNSCPFNVIDLVHNEVDARFVVFRSTCLTAQQLIKDKQDKKWFTQHGIVPRTLIRPQETLHHIYRWLYAEVMTPRSSIQQIIDQYKQQFHWDEYFMVGIHIRTGGVNKERIHWGRFLDDKDVQMFKKYAKMLEKNYKGGVLEGYVKKSTGEEDGVPAGVTKFLNRAPIRFYVLSDQDMIKENIMEELGEEAVTTKCEMTHTNRSRKKKDDPGFICALVENYLLSSTDFMILTTRSTYGYLARHRTNSPYITVDKGCYANWKKLKHSEKLDLPTEHWSALYM